MVMPKMGESIMEGTILKWLKKEGDSINEDESVLEVATDKVDTEIPSTCSGTISQILVNEGDIVKVGSPIAIIIGAGTDRPCAAGEAARCGAITTQNSRRCDAQDQHMILEP